MHLHSGSVHSEPSHLTLCSGHDYTAEKIASQRRLQPRSHRHKRQNQVSRCVCLALKPEIQCSLRVKASRPWLRCAPSVSMQWYSPVNAKLPEWSPGRFQGCVRTHIRYGAMGLPQRCEEGVAMGCHEDAMGGCYQVPQRHHGDATEMPWAFHWSGWDATGQFSTSFHAAVSPEFSTPLQTSGYWE